MTERVVLDASIAITKVMQQVGAADVERRLRRWVATGTRLIVPSNFWLEVANALIRRHRVSGALLMETLFELDELGLETEEGGRPLLLLAMDRAERFGLMTYDATYLALAELVDATLYTSDRALLAAAGTRGLALDAGGEHRLSETAGRYGEPRRPTWPDYSGASAYLAQLRGEARRPA
ncbi:MAG: type II toxin-antitoxin system VapC family toxin [Chloroflexi bacterium]|nr:type II toxin-antitoxin system VapC family toxin [Chloroflexota bacterium]